MQICYILAFGFTPLRPGLLVTLAAPSSLYLLFLLTSSETMEWWLRLALPVYCGLITTMAWRAVAFTTSHRAKHWYLGHI